MMLFIISKRIEKAMIAEIRNGEDKIPYIELYITLDESSDFEITFRAYYKTVTVGIEDNRANQSGGQDIEDCWIAPVVIIEKTSPKNDFNPFMAFLRAMEYGGYYVKPEIQSMDFDMDLIRDWYTEIEPVVNDWIKKIGVNR
jgi:hypothetical protein